MRLPITDPPRGHRVGGGGLPRKRGMGVSTPGGAKRLERLVIFNEFYRAKKNYFLFIPDTTSRATPIAARRVVIFTGDFVWIGAGVDQE